MDEQLQSEKGPFKICGQEIDIQEASEPTDIIWENRHFKPEQRSKKRIVIYFIIVLLLIVSAGVIYFFTVLQVKFNTKYPKIVCEDQFWDDYKVEVPKTPEQKEKGPQITKDFFKSFKDNAVKDYTNNKNAIEFDYSG